MTNDGLAPQERFTCNSFTTMMRTWPLESDYDGGDVDVVDFDDDDHDDDDDDDDAADGDDDNDDDEDDVDDDQR